jgi:WD40 repeat protein/beta-lactamase regulating signal transducer with metallopeptidase domain
MPAAIFEAVLGNLAVAAALAAVALAAGRWLNRPAVSHVLWLLVLVKLFTPPLVTIPVPCLPARTGAPTMTAVEAAAAPMPSVVPQPVVVVEPDPPAAPAPNPALLPPVAASISPPTPVPLSASAATGPLPLPSWDVALMAAWAAGSVVAAGLALRRVRRFARLLDFASDPPAHLVADVAAAARRMGLRPPRVRLVPGGIAPLVWAVGRPTLYFPAGLLDRLTPEQRFAVVAHELAHLRRWDHVVRVIEFAAMAVYWWCPLAWLARREFRRLEEEACDAEVAAIDPGSGYAYASAILETIDFLAGVAPAPAFASGIGDVGSLRRRLTLILEGRRPPRTSARARLALLVVALAVLVAGPKLTRLTAAVVEAASRSVEKSPALPVQARVYPDEPFTEAIHFLPTPTRLIGLPETGAIPYHAAALSPDGSRLAVADGPRVVVWDLAAQRVLFSLTGHAEAVNAVTFSPDGSRIATAGNDAIAVLWDAADGRRLHTLAGQGNWLLAAAFSPDGKTLATAGYDKTIRLWDVATGEFRVSWAGHAGGVRALAFSPDGKVLATGGADNEVRIWDVARGVTVHVKRHTAAVRVVAFSPDGSRLASGSEDRTLGVWNLTDNREAGPPLPVPDFVTALRFSPHGQTLFAGTLGGHLLSVNPATGQLRGYVGVEPGRSPASPAHGDAITAVLVPPSGSVLYSVSQDRTVLAWPSAGPPQAPRSAFRTGQPVHAVALSPDGRLVATGGPDGLIRLWDAATTRELATLPGHPGGVSALVFAAGGRLVSAGADERVRVWDLASSRPVRTVIQPTADLRIALSPDGRLLAIGGRKLRGVALLSLESGGSLRWICASVGEVSAVAFTPAGDRLATGYASGVVRLWSVATGEEIFRTSVGRGSVDAIAFAPDGATAAVVINGAPDPDGDAGPAHDVVFWDPRDGSVREAPRPLAHPGPLTAAAFADGNVLTAGHDGSLYLWDPAAARVLRTIRGHVDAVRGVALSADGTAVYSAGDRTAKHWPLTREN